MYTTVCAPICMSELVAVRWLSREIVETFSEVLSGRSGRRLFAGAIRDALGITSANGRMVKMVKRRKWKSASERNETGGKEGGEGGVIHKVVSHAECICVFNIRSRGYLRSFGRKCYNRKRNEERNIFRYIIDI